MRRPFSLSTEHEAMTNAIAAFARATAWGTLAGATPYTVLIIIPLAISVIGEENSSNIAVILVYPLILSGALVLASAVLFGLPLTAVLSHTKRDNSGTYALAGLGLGAIVPAATILAMGGELGGEMLFFAFPGTIAGFATGYSWGQWRETLNSQNTSAVEE